jgi:hypothetical protein
MITWNYRVFREHDGDYIIREVFYDEQNNILTCTAGAVEPFGQTLGDLAADIESFREALTLPILSLDDIPQTAPTERKHDRSKNISIDQLLQELSGDDSDPGNRGDITSKAA